MKTFTIDVDNCLKSLKGTYLEAEKATKEAIAAFRRLKIVITY